MTAYFISGLGADERIFERIVLPKGILKKHVHWIEPLPHEPLPDYCRRLLAQIPADDAFILIGLSFGGMVAIELNQFIHPKQIILISTVATASEFPLKFKLARFLRLHKIIPAWLLKIPNPVTDWIFGVKTPGEKKLIRSFLKQVTPRYLKWSMNAVLNWKNEQRPHNLVHILGKNDRIFPYAKTNADILIEKGGHLMVYDQAEKINRVLADVIDRQTQ